MDHARFSMARTISDELRELECEIRNTDGCVSVPFSCENEPEKRTIQLPKLLFEEKMKTHVQQLQ